uniref:Uncharacterized protein n=1 Tax=Arundo donax TaxID=35708 RepID=A0A0A8YUR2_ARUDO
MSFFPLSKSLSGFF